MASGLIESLILNIPIPFIYISQDVDVDEEVPSEQARYSVIDGQQRLTAISRYLQSEFALVGLKVLTNLNGSFYKDLPPFLIRRLEEPLSDAYASTRRWIHKSNTTFLSD